MYIYMYVIMVVHTGCGGVGGTQYSVCDANGTQCRVSGVDGIQ